MKKIVFLLVIFVLALGAGCKKKVEPVASPPPPPPPKITEVDFVKLLVTLPEVKNLKLEDFVNVKLNPEKVISPSAEFAIVQRLNSDWTYEDLLPISEQIPLTIVWVAKDGARLLVRDYVELREMYMPGDKFLILPPKPEYFVQVGENTYWLTESGNLWKTW
jgi:hypothetical protein